MPTRKSETTNDFAVRWPIHSKTYVRREKYRRPLSKQLTRPLLFLLGPCPAWDSNEKDPCFFVRVAWWRKKRWWTQMESRQICMYACVHINYETIPFLSATAPSYPFSWENKKLDPELALFCQWTMGELTRSLESYGTIKRTQVREQRMNNTRCVSKQQRKMSEPTPTKNEPIHAVFAIAWLETSSVRQVSRRTLLLCFPLVWEVFFSKKNIKKGRK